jgi:putative DNA primase/helicase
MKQKTSPTDDELASRWINRSDETIHCLGNFRRYGNGIWPKLTRTKVEGEILDVLKKAKSEGVRPSTGRLNSVINLARIQSTKKNELMEPNPKILVFPNGTLELTSRNFRDHSPLDYAISSLPYEYDENARPEAWLKILSRLSPEIVAFLQEYFGYCLTKETKHEIAVWLTGTSGCGKSAIIEGIKAMFGSLAVQLSISDIERSKFALPLIVGKSVIYSTEQCTDTPTSVDILNKIVSGETMMIEAKYEAPFNYKPNQKLIWASTDLPYIPTGDGFYRRFQVINVPPLPPDKRDIDIKRLISQEGPGIFNWALAGLRRLEQRGHFDIPQSVRSATEQFEVANDTIQEFVEECCVLDPGKRIQTSVIYTAYRKWCEINGRNFLSNIKLSEEWIKRGFTRKEIVGCRYWQGIALRPELGYEREKKENYIFN